MTFWITTRYVTPKDKRYSSRFGPTHIVMYLVECEDDPDFIPIQAPIYTSLGPSLNMIRYKPPARRRALKHIKGIKIWREWGPFDKRSTRKFREARKQAQDLIDNPFLLRVLDAAAKHS